MSTVSPSPFPTNGVRKLSPREMLQRAKALACTLPQNGPPTCSGQVFVGIFFDGTGNNLVADFDSLAPESRKHSNIVKLFQTYQDSRSKPGHYSFYIPGVGTPFPQIEDKGGKLGSIAAEYGEHRIIWAFTRLLNAPHQFAMQGAQLIPDNLAHTIVANVASATSPGTMRRVVLRTWQDRLRSVLERAKPRVELINLSVFGFSRGAAQARAFANWLFESCEADGGGWSFAGVPIRLQFLGLFDTVASVGLTNLLDNGIVVGHQSWADNNLEIHPSVEQCAHFVAGHEVRSCFPLDSVRIKGKYPGNAMEVMYPGAHSDVGGGYAPKALGVSPKPESFVCIIPGVNMFHEARKAGVPLVPFDQLDPDLQVGFTPSAPVIRQFNAYVSEAKIGSGPVEEMHRRHMSLYFSLRLKKLNSIEYFHSTPYADAPPKDRSYLYKTQRDFFIQMFKLRDTVVREAPEYAKKWPFLLKYGKFLDAASRSWDEWRASPSIWETAVATAWKTSPLTFVPRLATAVVSANMQRNAMLHAFEVAQHINVESVTPEIESFLSHYIHDSMAGFIDMGMDEYKYNGVGIAKFRSIFTGND